jgi:hypothetical protein
MICSVALQPMSSQLPAIWAAVPLWTGDVRPSTCCTHSVALHNLNPNQWLWPSVVGPKGHTYRVDQDNAIHSCAALSNGQGHQGAK